MTGYIDTPTIGEILQEEFMEPMDISAYKLAQEIHVPVSRIQDILHDRRKITADTSLRLAKYFGVSDRYFLDMQNDIDIRNLKISLAEEINKIFFEVIIAPDYDVDALEILGQKKNRIILVRKPAALPKKQFRSLLNGVLVQDRDLKVETPEELKTVTTKAPTAQEIEDMLFANKIVKNSKSNAIVLAKGKQLLASGVGQTSRVDALKQAIEKAKNFGFDLNGAVMASDAFFPFPDCVEIAGNEGVTAVIQPGGSIKDELSFEYCNEHGIAMVTTGFRHFKH